MGVNIRELIIKKTIDLDDLSGKVIAIDTFNMLYQFLTTIRQRDGSLLTDSSGKVTSHLIGLLSRTTKLMQKNMKLIFVFDGEAPKIKKREIEKRRAVKEKAKEQYAIAKEREDIESMKKFAGRFTYLTPEMVEEAKLLINYLGLPVVQAPSEGEAQVAYMAKQPGIFAGVSQDYDTLLYGAPKLIQNLSIAGRRKQIRGVGYRTIKPELINLSENLNNLGIDQHQLIALGILIGTDYNPGGIKGIGPKKALKLVKQHGKDFKSLFTEVKFDEQFEHTWKEVFDHFIKMPVDKKYSLKRGNIKKEKIIELLVEQHDFSEERVQSSLDNIKKEITKRQQKTLGDF